MSVKKAVGGAVSAAVRYYMPATLVILALLVIWQLAVDLLQVKEYILPSPWSALKALDRPTYRWPANFLTTFYAVLGAFVLSAVLGIALAIAIVWNWLLLRTIMPVLVLFNTLPKIALAPLFILWLGYGVWPNIVIGTTIAFFPMVVNTAIGSRAPSPNPRPCAHAARHALAGVHENPLRTPFPTSPAQAERHHVRDRRHRRRVRSLRAWPGRPHHLCGRDARDAVDLRLAHADLAARARALWAGGARRAARRPVGAARAGRNLVSLEEMMKKLLFPIGITAAALPLQAATR